MSTYYVRGVTSATATTADHAIFEVWNPDSAKRIALLEFGIFKTAAGASGDSAYLVRTTAKGTSGSTVTPDADNSGDADDVPASAFTLELGAFSGQPTLASPPMIGWVASAAAGSGMIWPCPRGIWIPPGTGIALCQRVNTAWPVSEVYAVIQE